MSDVFLKRVLQGFSIMALFPSRIYLDSCLGLVRWQMLACSVPFSDASFIVSVVGCCLRLGGLRPVDAQPSRLHWAGTPCR